MNKIIQWNIRGSRVNYSELLLIITKYCSAIIYLQETHLKNNTSINMKNYYSYNYVKQYTDRPCGGSSIIINNDINRSEITLNTNMQAVAISAILHKTITEKVKIKFQSKNIESYNQPFSRAELKESLNKAHNTAVGPDKIHYRFLKELSEPSTNFLLQIFNDLWNSGDIHKIWKETTVIPIPKHFKDNTNAKITDP